MRHETDESLTRICLAVFRLNGALLDAGDELALSDTPLTAPRIAQAMGLTRQGSRSS